MDSVTARYSPALSDASSTDADTSIVDLTPAEKLSVLAAATKGGIAFRSPATLLNYSVTAKIEEDNSSQIAFSISSIATGKTIVTVNLSNYEFKSLTGKL